MKFIASYEKNSMRRQAPEFVKNGAEIRSQSQQVIAVQDAMAVEND